MKKIILATLLITLFVSCSKEETAQKKLTDNELIGTWKVVSVTSENGKISGTFNNIPISSEFSATGKDYTMLITFSDNPKKISSTGGFTLISELKVLTQTQSFEQKIDSIPATNGIWKVENNTLTTVENGITASIKIVSYSNSEIVFKYSIDENTNSISDFNLNNTKIQADIILKALKQ